MTRYFCSYFDRHYLTRFLVLYESLRRWCGPFRFWVLCMDDETYAVLVARGLPEVIVVRCADFEQEDAELAACRINRSLIEYYFTCTAAFVLFVLKRFPEIDLLTYLDVDLYFFSNLEPLYDEIGMHSIALVAHRFSSVLRHLEVYGTYNVGWLSFRRDEHGMACLEWWRARCVEWCYDHLDHGRFADQKYLDEWPARFKNVIVLAHKGANVGPWNILNHPVTGTDPVMVGDEPLVFFHFHGLRRICPHWYEAGCQYQVALSRQVRRHIYLPYIRALVAAEKQLGAGPRLSGMRTIRRRRQSIRQLLSPLVSLYRYLLEGHLMFVPDR